MSQLTVPVEYGGKQLQVNQGGLEYLAGIDTFQEWEQRGYKATHYVKSDRSEVQQRIIDQVKNNLDFEESEKLQNFVEESLEILSKMSNKEFDFVDSIFGDKTVYFITGPPRTGGTYVLKALLDLRNDNLKAFNHKLIFDYCPLNTQLGEYYGEGHTNQVLFGWAQWMAWVRRRFDLETYNFIPKKHIGALYQLDLLNKIFGDQAKFIVTTRDPAEAYQSYMDRFASGDSTVDPSTEIGLWKYAVIPRTNIDEERWDDFDLPDQFLLYWCACYLEILHYDNPEQIHPLIFGEDYERFLKEFAWEYNLVYSPEKFDPTEREDLPEFSAPCEEMKEKVETMWKDKFDKELY